MRVTFALIFLLVANFSVAEVTDYSSGFRSDPEKAEFEAIAREKGIATGGKVVIGELSVPSAGLFSPRGRIGEVLEASSGERIEVRWEGIWPRYGFYYVPSPEAKGIRIGRCHFSYGCNRVFFVAEGDGPRNSPARFLLVQWASLDFGYDQDVPGYLDRYRHVFDPRTGEYVLYHDLLSYRCDPPLGAPPNVCLSTCEPPFETVSIGENRHPLVFTSEAKEVGKSDVTSEERWKKQGIR